MPHQGPPGERDRRLAEEVLYLHSLWRGGPDAPAPIQSRSAGRAPLGLHRVLRGPERERLLLYRILNGKQRKRRRINPALAPPPPASSRETLAEAAGASAPSTANPPPPTTPPGPLARREAVRSSAESTGREPAGDDLGGPDSDGDRAEEEREAAAYFTGLFQRDARLRGHYTERWRKGRFQCMVCAAGEEGWKKAGKPRRFRGCLSLLHHARDASRSRSRYGRWRGAHGALAGVVCRMLGWDIERLSLRVVTKSGVQHAKGNDGYSTDDDSYSVDEDEESEDEECEDEEEDTEIGMLDPGTDGDEEDSETESSEEYAQKEDHEDRMEDTSTDGDEYADELERSKEADQKEAANSIARKRDMKIRDGMLRLTHAKPMDTTPNKT